MASFFTRSLLASDPSALFARRFSTYICIYVFMNTHVYISFGIWRLEQNVIFEARVARCFLFVSFFFLGWGF